MLNTPSLGALASWRWWGLLFLAGVFFILFGLLSYQLFAILKANLELLAEHGWQAAGDGGLRQLAELLALGYVSLLCWIGFKVCETRLVRELCPPSAPKAPPHP